jgi:WD domain, G-beta repeat
MNAAPSRRPLLALVLLAAGLAFLASDADWEREPSPDPTVGVWRVSGKQLRRLEAAANPGGGLWDLVFAPSARSRTLIRHPEPFRFDGRSVHYERPRWLMRRFFEVEPDDGVYRLEARWWGNVLYSRHAGGHWMRWGEFVDGHFRVRDHDGVFWDMEKADPRELTGSEVKLLWNRPLWRPWGWEEPGRPLTATLEWVTAVGEKVVEPVEPVLVVREDLALLDERTGFPDSISDVGFSPDGKHLVTAGYGWDPDLETHPGYVKLWDASTGQGEGTLEGLPSPVARAVFNPDGSRLALVCGDGVTRLWDPGARREVLSLERREKSAGQVAFSPDGRQLASAGEDGTVIVWDAASGEELHALKGHPRLVEGLAFHPDGRRLTSCGRDALRVWELASGAEEKVTPLADGGHCQAVHPDGVRAVFSDQRHLRVWDAGTGRSPMRFSKFCEHERDVKSAAFGPDGRLLATGGDDNAFKLWDAEQGRVLCTVRLDRGNSPPGAGVQPRRPAPGDDLPLGDDRGVGRAWSAGAGARRPTPGEGASRGSDGVAGPRWRDDHVGGGLTRREDGRSRRQRRDGAVVGSDEWRAADPPHAPRG